MTKLIAFDLDGTLIDSLPTIAHSLNTALAGVDYPTVTVDIAKTWVGNGSDVLVARGLSNSVDVDETLCPELLKKARFLFNQAYQDAGHARDVIYPSVVDTLAELKQQGYELAILTNKTECFIEPILTHFNIAQHFTHVIAGNTLAERKPSPIGLHWLAQQYGISATDIIMVGDSENDIKAAQAAGAISIGLTYGYNYGRPIADVGPSFVIDTLAEMLNLPCIMGAEEPA